MLKQAQPIYDLVADELQAIEQLIDQELDSDIALIGKLSKHLIKSGGKRIRPLLLLLSALNLNYRGDEHIKLAAVLEFVHTATLLHDDVVDGSDLRRGKQTANQIWGNQASVLVGDFLYSRAFQLMVDVEQIQILQTIARTTNTIARGEILQLIHCKDTSLNEAQYLDIIRSKTAALFGVAAEIGAMLAEGSPSQKQALAQFGMHLGTVFQLIDDVLDYDATCDEIGKNIGDDLAEGKLTLPLIYALSRGDPQQQQFIQRCLTKSNIEDIEEMKIILKETEALAYSRQIARNEMHKALDCLQAIPENNYRDALESLAQFALERSH